MPKKSDASQAEIVVALRRVGATVQDLHEIGYGCPDLLVAHKGQLYLLEVKSQSGRLTPNEHDWIWCWESDVHVVRTIDEALRAIGAEVVNCE